MKILTQKLKVGTINVIEAPIPTLQNGELLVRNAYSCISAGTESGTVRAARKGYIGKAKQRPDQAKQAFEKLKSQGPLQTYRAVMKKLDAHSTLGYSSVGKVMEVAADVSGFSVGDYVACAGSSASHAEVISVPANLCVKIPQNTDLKQAAYNTLGAIAMQGIRQADLRLGEMCAVVGLGLLGQLTCVLLKASGVNVIGIDIDPEMVNVATKNSSDAAFLRNDPGVEQHIVDLSNGMGCDAVIITAASNSVDPINFAGSISRKKGTVVVVGAIPTGFDREPHYYNKELTLKMSCSYGPGRYDPFYEKKNIDYPYAYVRWTENRNMRAFQELIAHKKIDISYLTTHTYRLEDAYKAYDMILEKAVPFLGILIEYDLTTEITKEKVSIHSNRLLRTTSIPSVSIGFIGAGSYAQNSLLPHIPQSRNVSLKTVVTATSAGSRSVADRFGFHSCSTDANDILNDPSISTVFIATRHDSHAEYVIRALRAGKHVFVEKPLCFTTEELEEIRLLVNQETPKSGQVLMVGYNRRFSPLTQRLKANFRSSPMSMVYRVNAGKIPSESWIQDKDFGGGRILGEVCHFIDYLSFINGSLPRFLNATAMSDQTTLHDTVSISVQYQNGSIGTVHYFSNGSSALKKEYVEIYQTGTTAVLNDFTELTIFGKGKPQRKRLLVQDKGQKNEVKLFIKAIEKGMLPPIAFEELYNASLVSIKAMDSLRSRAVVSV